MKFLFFLLIVIIVAVGFWLMSVYNRLQAMMQRIREELSNLQAILKKRMDLAHQIIDIAKDYGDHEKITLMGISQNQSSLQNMQLLAQNYPALRANETYQNLMNKLEGLENQILSQRMTYNAVVRNYNSYRNNFPAVLIAQKLSFGIAPYYEIEDPDFIEKVKVFDRDDSLVLQELVAYQSKALGAGVQKAGVIVKQKIGEGQEFAQKKLEEYHAKEEEQHTQGDAQDPSDADIQHIEPSADKTNKA